MQERYFKEYSHHLNRDMEFKVYGESGTPCVVFPCQAGRFFDWENRGMCSLAADYINSGRLTLICVDSIDAESWADKGGDNRHRTEMQEAYFHYICDELVPRAMQLGSFSSMPLAAGASLGAYHAVNFYLRRPDLFSGTIALSGLYFSEEFFGDYMDDLLYNNTPERYMANFPANHPYYGMWAPAHRVVICVGQGAWEGPLAASTRRLGDILAAKGVPATVDIWGWDVNHDWPWWEKQWVYFLPRVLG